MHEPISCNDVRGDELGGHCVRSYDEKQFALPRKFTRKQCLDFDPSRMGFTQRASCAPWIGQHPRRTTNTTNTMNTTNHNRRRKGRRRKGRRRKGRRGKGRRSHRKGSRTAGTNRTENHRNIYNKPLESCGAGTGYRRDGYCTPDSRGNHIVCAEMTDAFLDFAAERGNDLREVTGPGKRWCICEGWWHRARTHVDEGGARDDVKPRLVADATHSTARI